jgi:hypothetical protein
VGPADDDGATAPFVVQPYRNYWLFWAAVLALTGGVQLTSALHRGRPWAALAGAVVVLVAVLLAAEALVARVTWDGAVLRRHDLGRSAEVRRSDLGTAVLLPAYRPTRRGEPSPLLVFLDPGGRSLLRLGGGMWRDDEVVGLAEEVAGDAVERVDGLTSLAELQRLHPGALTTAERHRRLVSALTVAYVVGVVLLDLHRWSG